MEVKRPIYRFFGTTLFALGIFLLLSLLILLSFDAQMRHISTTVNTTVDSFVTENYDQILASDPANEPYINAIADCDAGLRTEEECQQIRDQVSFDNDLEETKMSVTSQLRDFYAPVKSFLSFWYVYLAVAVVSIALGLWLLYLSSKKNWLIVGTVVSLRLGTGLLFWLLFVLPFANLQPETLAQYMTAGDVPQIFALFSAELLLNIVKPTLQPFVYPLIILTILSFVTLFVLLIYRWKKDKTLETEHRS